MPQSNLIPILLALPLLGAILTLLVPRKNNPQLAAYIALACSLAPLGIVLYMLTQFKGLGAADAPSTDWQFPFDYNWLNKPFGITLSMGVDTIGLWLIVLTAVLTPVAILGSFNYIKERQPEFYAWMLMLHAGMLGVFAARDILVFYLFFEFTLIPMFFIIGIWGGQDRRKAAGKFFLFTFAGSVLTLVSLVYLSYIFYGGYHAHGVDIKGSGHFSFQLTDLTAIGAALPRSVQCWVFLGLMAGFAVKVPLFPVHTWLPLAHTEAPTAGSVILAGVLLKLGTYGLLRFAVPVLPQATLYFAPMIAVVCIVGIVYGALVSWAQGDMKKLIAYSSVSHLAFCVLGMFALTKEGLTGSILYMLNHGLSTGALFLVVGMIYERYHTRDMNQVGGIVRRVPALGFFCIFFVFSSVALPGLNGFISEFLVLLGTFVSGGVDPHGHRFGGNLGPAYAIPAATGVILGAVYLLYWAGRVVFGPLKEPADQHAHHEEDTGAAKGHQPIRDLSLREWLVLAPMAAMILYMGVFPYQVMHSLEKPVEAIANKFNGADLPVRTADQAPAPAPAAPVSVPEVASQ